MAAWTSKENDAFRAKHPVKMPEQQAIHNYPHADTKGYLDFIFAMDRHEYKGLVPVATRKADGTMKTVAVVPAEQIGEWVSKMHISTKLDYYIGRAQQSSPDSKWGKESAFCYNAIYADIDCHSDCGVTVNPKYVADLICDALSAHSIPTPNAVVYSGRGIHLVWAIEQVARTLGWMVMAVSVAYSAAVEAVLRNHGLAGYNVDYTYARSVAGLTRLPGSYNTAARTYVTMEILHRVRLDLLRAYDSIPATPMGWRKVSYQRHRKNAVTAAGTARVRSLLRLVDIRGGTIEVGGRDNYLLGLYSSCRMSGMDDDEAVECVLTTNKRFVLPMPSEEILAYLSTARRKGGYKYCTVALIDLLGITTEEQTAIGLSIGTKERNAARDRRTAAKRRARNRQIMELYLRGWTVYEIADTGVACCNTVRAVIREHLSQAAIADLFNVAELVMIIRDGKDQKLKTHIIILIGVLLDGNVSDDHRDNADGIGIPDWGWRHRWSN